MKTGLVIGKFFPLHRGHQHLIDVASAHCDRLVVVVCDKRGEVISAEVRAQWIRELYPHAIVHVWKDIGHDDDSEAWAVYTIKMLGHSPGIVFTSENYGELYAKYLGATHYLVDRERSGVSMSGTLVRKNVWNAWGHLSAPVRATLATRVVVLGAESTGTTTLAKALAKHYETTWVPEYGREYSEDKVRRGAMKWKSDEFIHIAAEQLRREHEAARNANKVLICDTDAFATTLWHERYMGNFSQEVASIADRQQHELYVLTGDEIPFVQDGFRDGEHIRHAMHKKFVDELKRTRRNYILVEGPHEERLTKAIVAIDGILEERSQIPLMGGRK